MTAWSRSDERRYSFVTLTCSSSCRIRRHVFVVSFMHAASRWELCGISLHRSGECFERQKIHSWDCSRFFKSNAKIAKIVRELLSVQCSWEDFRHVLSNKLSKWLEFHLRRISCKKLYFVIYFLCYWRWKRKFLNKLKRSLVTIWGVIIFSPTMRQEGSSWNADRLLGEVVYNYYSDAQVSETLRMSEMFWCLLSQFLCDKSERNINYLDVCFALK